MITPALKSGTPRLQASLLLCTLLMFVVTARLSAQQPAFGADTAPPPAPTSQTSGLLTPPPDTSAPDTTSSNTVSATNTPDAATPPPVAAPAAKPVRTTTSTPMTRQQIARMQQQEIVRRQELIFRANESLSAGRKAELAQDYPEARKDYLFCVEAYGSISRATVTYSKSAEGLTRVDFQLTDAALARGDTQQAKRLIDEVVQYNPNNKLANQKLAAINRALANPNDTSILGNPAVTPGFVNKVDQVQQLLALAEQYRRTGQWDMAEITLKKILALDSYNVAATKALERIDTEKENYAEHARLETRDERLRQVEENWYAPISNNEVNPGAQEPQSPFPERSNFSLDQKLKSIFLSLDFDNATIEEATNYLTVKSKELDPDKKGVNFVIDPAASTSAKPITLSLNNVPMGEALRYICQIAGVKFKVQDYAVSIVSLAQNTDELISRTFSVPPSFVAPPQATPDLAGTTSLAFGNAAPVGAATRPLPTSPGTTGESGAGSGENTILKALEDKGLKFPPGASALYSPSTGQLTVVNTADQMEFLEELVYAGQAPTLMVRVATKFIEINQTDLNDLTVNTAVNFNSVLGAPAANGGIAFATNLPGIKALQPDSIDFLISPTPTAENHLAVRGFIDHAAIDLVLDALSQKRSFDLLTEPSVMTKSGEQGTLEAVRIFPYPIAFDPPVLAVAPIATSGTTVTEVELGSPPTVIPATPSDFARRQIGERLVVRPQIVADNKTIDLSLFPEVTDFEGFINYGNPIFIVNPTTVSNNSVFGGIVGTTRKTGLDPTSLLSANQINQPVFNTRRINTKVLIHDGSTVVIGGLMRDDVETVNDSVPFLSDLPLIGRLFKSKAVEDTKKNLLIFVTATIYRTDGELLNPPEGVNPADVLTGRATVTPIATP